jgi:hypothetical protein
MAKMMDDRALVSHFQHLPLKKEKENNNNFREIMVYFMIYLIFWSISKVLLTNSLMGNFDSG